MRKLYLILLLLPLYSNAQWKVKLEGGVSSLLFNGEQFLSDYFLHPDVYIKDKIHLIEPQFGLGVARNIYKSRVFFIPMSATLFRYHENIDYHYGVKSPDPAYQDPFYDIFISFNHLSNVYFLRLNAVPSINIGKFNLGVGLNLNIPIYGHVSICDYTSSCYGDCGLAYKSLYDNYWLFWKKGGNAQSLFSIFPISYGTSIELNYLLTNRLTCGISGELNRQFNSYRFSVGYLFGKAPGTDKSK